MNSFKLIKYILLIFVSILLVSCFKDKQTVESAENTVLQSEIILPKPSIIKAYDVTANDQADISLELYNDSTFTLFFQQFPFPDELVRDPSDTLQYKHLGRWSMKNEKYVLNLNQNNRFDLKALFELGDGIEIINKNTFSFDTSKDTISIWGLHCINRKL